MSIKEDAAVKLNEAYENLLYEKQTQTSRGGNSVSSSMDAEGYE